MTKVMVDVCRYWVQDGALQTKQSREVYEVSLREFEHRPGEVWLFLDGGPWSLLLTPGSIKDITERGWLAQSGTPPVEIDGVWGGRNYPEMVVPAQEIKDALIDLKVLAT